jgi:cellulose synthase/poly-beta-1,6-N-acetylglucosamine synthase-like glycosyltransferase
MEQKNKLIVSIGTTALNEEQNIKRFLDSVCVQKQDSISIKEIIVISDGSTDATVDIVQKHEDSRLKVIIGEKRQGKPSRLNQLLKLFKGDVLVCLDADTILKNKLVVERLVKPLIKDRAIGLIGGNPQPLPAETFLEGAVNNYFYARDQLREESKFEKTAHAAHGRIMAFSRRFANRLHLPENILGDDVYSFLQCKKLGLKFYHEKKAIVWYRSPQNWKDYATQATRFLAGGKQLYRYFNSKEVDKAFRIPKPVLRKQMLLQLKKNPLGYIFLKILNLYCFWRKKVFLKQLDIKWVSIRSSKRL